MKLLSCFKLTHEFKKQLSSRFLHVVLERLGNTKASRLCDKMHFIIFGGSLKKNYQLYDTDFVRRNYKNKECQLK